MEVRMNEQLLVLISKQLEEINAMLTKQEQRQGQSQGKMGRPSKEHIVVRYRKRVTQTAKRWSVPS